MPGIAFVTDSTSMLSAADAAAAGITVVPLDVVIDDVVLAEGEAGATASDVAEALRARRSVTTSRITPVDFARLYAELALQGYEQIVSVHLSADLSGTVDAARQAAELFAIPVHVVDSRTAGPALGWAVRAAAQVVQGGATAEEGVKVAVDTAERASSWFYVDSLDHLRRGGRISTASAILGTALGVKPILALVGGVVVVKERPRGAARAFRRLEELALQVADQEPSHVTVAHVDNRERAEGLAGYFRAHLGERTPGVTVQEVGGVLAAHLGPAMVAVIVSPVAAAHADEPAVEEPQPSQD